MAETDPKATAYLLLQTLTDFQKTLHETKNEDEEDVVQSDYVIEQPKKSWNVELTVPLTQSERNAESADVSQSVYTADGELDFLIKTCLVFDSPRARVKKQFKDTIQIRLCYNMPHNAVKNARLYFNGKADSSALNRHVYDIKSALFMSPGAGMRQHYDYMIGNIPCLQEWGIELPSVKITFPQPWYYAEHKGNAIPLFKLPRPYKIEHVYTFNRPIDVLMMRVRDKENDTWKLIKPDIRFLDFIDNKTKFKTPVMMGRYAKLPDAPNDDEKQWHIGPKGPSHSYLVTTYMQFSSKNPCATGENAEIDITLPTPARAMYILAENNMSKEKHNFSNYTTNSDDVNYGLNPVQSVTDIFDKKPHATHEQYQLDRSNIWDHFPSAPLQLGYNVISFYGHLGDSSCNTGIVLGSSYMPYSVRVSLADYKIAHNMDDDQNEDPQAGDKLLKEVLRSNNHKDTDPDQLYVINVIIENFHRVTVNYKEAETF